MKKHYLLLLVLVSFIALQVNAQWSINTLDTDHTIDFETTVSGVNEGAFDGSGFATTPATGQLNADAWAVSGMSDGFKDFGVEKNTGDFARGSSTGGVVTAGIYSFEVETGNYTLGVQPSGSDFAPGWIGLKLQNNTGETINSINFSYDIWEFNNEGRSSTFDGEYSSDGTSWYPIPELAYATGLVADATPTWVKTTLSYSGFIGADIANGGFLYFRWSSVDNGGSGARDEIAVDNITVNLSYELICNPITSFPFFEGFEDTYPVDCWTLEYANAAYPSGNAMSHSTSQAYEGSQSFRFSSYFFGAPYEQYLITPELNMSSTQLVEFWYRRYSSGSETFAVGTSTTGNNITTDFTWGADVTDATASWKKFSMDLNADVKYVAIQYKTQYSYYLYVDNFTVREVSSENDILTFSFSEQTGLATIDNVAHTVEIEVAMHTDLSALTPTITVSDYASISPESGVAQDFTNPVTYTVTAEDGTTTQDWLVTVTESTTQSSEKNIVSFTLPTQTGPATIDNTLNTVEVEVDWLTDITALTPTIIVSDLATISPLSGVQQDFTTPVTYTVTAEDASTKDYTVTVNLATAPLGANCSNPFLVDIPADLTYQDLSQTNCGLGNIYQLVGQNYTGGEDAIYRLDVTSSTVVKLTMTTTTSWTGLFLFDACPDVGNIITSVTNSGTSDRVITHALNTGTYYIMIDTYASPDCIPEYNLTIEAMCPAPTAIETINLTATSTDLQWTAGGFETAWNIKVNEATAIADPSTTDGDIIANNPVSPTPEYSIVSGLTAETDYYVYIQADCGSDWVEFMFTTLPTCPTPTDLTASNITVTSADLSWTENGTATSWNLKVTTAATFDPTSETGNIFDGAATGNTHPLSGLDANTTYYWYVQTDCTGGDLSEWSAEGEFSTPCEPISTLPFFEGFESGYTDQNAVDGCWTQESITGTQVWTANSSLTTYNRTPRTGSFNAYLRYSNTDWMYYAFNLTAGTTYRVNLYARQDATAGANITVSYGDNAEATSMTNAIIPETAVTNGDYQLLTGDFTPAADGIYYIGILGELTSSPWYLSIDDFEVLEAPATTITWCNLQHPGTHTMHANETVDIYARAYEDGVTNADANAAGTGVECWIGYSETNTDPSTWANWTPATYNLDVGNNDEFVATLETLTPGTYYYASRWRLDGGLYSYGGFDGGFWDGTTNVSGVLTVNTAIGTDCSNPFLVDIPADLTYQDLSQTNCGLGDIYDDTNISNGYYDNGEDAIYQLNVIADTYVRISLDPKATTYSSLSLFDGCPDTGALIDDNLNSGTNLRIIEVGLTTGTYYVMVDTWSTPDCITEYDLTIEAMCPAPTTIETINLTATSTDLQWTAGGFETSWNIKVNEATAIADPSITDGDIIANNPVSPTPEYSIVSGLTAETDYYVYIQADCGSDWVEFMFTTLPTCPTPTDLTASNITVTSADLSWTENGTATSWNLKVTTAATFDPTSETGNIFDGAATGNTHPLSGLDANTTYYWYVQTDCTGGDLSEWSAEGEFTTQCDIIALPFFEGFENNSTTLNCWTALDLDADGYTWALYTEDDSYEGEQSMVSRWHSSGTSNDWLISPQLAIDADNYVLDFFAKSTSSTMLEDFEVLVSTTGNNPADFTIMLESITSHPNAWTQHIYKLSDHGISSGDNIYIAIRHISADQFRLLVDAFQVRALSSETDFITYSFPEQTGAAVIDYTAHTIDVEVGNGTNLAGLIANFEVSESATADIAGTTQESGVTVNDFTTSVTYTVTAEDGTTTQDWLVTVTEAAINTETDIVTYTFPEATSVAAIDNTEKTVDINVLWHADITALTAEFELSYGASASIGGTTQVSATTTNDFTMPVTYTVTAEDGTTTTDWTVNVTPDDVPLGANCENPFTVSLPANLPYSDAGQTTCGLGNVYEDTELNYYDGGEDAIYEITVTSDVVVNIMLDPGTNSWTGIGLFSSCPSTDNMIELSTNSLASIHGFEEIALSAGTYYIMIDSWPSPNCIDSYELSITPGSVLDFANNTTLTLTPETQSIAPGDDANAVLNVVYPETVSASLPTDLMTDALLDLSELTAGAVVELFNAGTSLGTYTVTGGETVWASEAFTSVISVPAYLTEGESINWDVVVSGLAIGTYNVGATLYLGLAADLAAQTNMTEAATDAMQIIVAEAIPEINVIDLNNAVADVAVCLGTDENEAIVLLADVITITDTEDNEFTVSLNWTIDAYDASTPAVYDATGTFELPAGVSQTDPVTALEVTATVTVNALPVVTCPQTMNVAVNTPVDFTGQTPEGGTFSGTGVVGNTFDPNGLDNGTYAVTYTYTDPSTGCENSCEFNVIVDIDISVADITLEGIGIYPNPNNGQFAIDFNNIEGSVNYQIYDTKGSIIVSKDISANGNTIQEVSLNLVPGVYFVKIVTTNQTHVEKLVIE